MCRDDGPQPPWLDLRAKTGSKSAKVFDPPKLLIHRSSDSCVGSITERRIRDEDRMAVLIRYRGVTASGYHVRPRFYRQNSCGTHIRSLFLLRESTILVSRFGLDSGHVRVHIAFHFYILLVA